jgi:hypothetical protein
VQLREVLSGGDYLSQHDLHLHFGPGSNERIDKGEILWPDGKTETLSDLADDHFYTIRRGKGAVVSEPPGFGFPK